MDSKVLSRIFLHLPTETLYKLRCVSRSWNRAACLNLQSRIQIEFHHVSDISKYLSIFGNHHSDNLHPMPIPHTRYHFAKIRLNLILDNYLLRTFFKKVPTATHIAMDFFGPQFRFKYLRLCALEHMSNVKSVVLTFKDFYEIWPNSLNDDADYPINGVESVESLTIYGFGREVPLKSTITKILPYFPNISRIEAGEQIGRIIFDTIYRTTDWNLDNDDDNDGVNWGKVAPSFDKLSQIDFSHLYPIQLEIITNRLNLKSLSGSLNMCSEQEVQKCLNSLSPTLKNLVLESNSENFNFSAGTKMRALVNLELTKFKLDLVSLDKFPALKRLRLKKVQIVCPKFQDLMEKNTSLSTLILEFCEINANILQIFGKMFPQIRRLDLPFYNFEDNNIFREICTNLTVLSEVRLSTGWNNLDREERNESKKEEILSEFIGDCENLRIWNEHSENDFRRVKVVDRESEMPLGWVVVE